MDGLDGLLAVHAAMIGDEYAMGIAPDADVVDIAEVGNFRGEAAQPMFDLVAILGICLLALKAAQLQRLDMRIDLCLRSKLFLEGRFERRCDLMGVGQPHGTIDFEIETYRHLVGNMLNGEVMNRKR